MTQARNLGNVGDAISGSSNTNVSFDSNTLVIDSVNNKIGINKVPTEDFDIQGNTISSIVYSQTATTTNLVSGNISTTTVSTNQIVSSGSIVLESNAGANSISFLANGVVNLSTGIGFPDGTVQTTKASGGGLNSSIVQNVNAIANTVVDLSLGDVVNINMANNITNLSFTNATKEDIVYVILNMDSNTRTVSSIANCSSSVVIGYKDNPFIFRLTTNNYGNNWIYTTQGAVANTARKSLWSWGNNGSGQLGQNDRTSRSSPTQVGSLTTWSQVACGDYHSIATKSDGTLWSWGKNSYGNLGLNDITHRSSPVQVGSLTNWSLISVGQYHSIATKSDGTLWSWGRNGSPYYFGEGQLGQNDTTHRSSPVQVGSLTNWSKISCYAHNLAIKTDGSLWSWGGNYYGELGQNDTTHRSSPVQVGTLTNWYSVYTGKWISFSIKTDGTLWAWGSSDYGNLGTGLSSIKYSSPVQVGSMTNWSKICPGNLHSLAIKNDGTLFGSGYNSSGQLGLNDTNLRTTFTQIGSLNSWKELSSSTTRSSFALKFDGTLWVWGENIWGDIGLVDMIPRSSPTQVGSLTNWSLVANCRYATLALQ